MVQKRRPGRGRRRHGSRCRRRSGAAPLSPVPLSPLPPCVLGFQSRMGNFGSFDFARTHIPSNKPGFFAQNPPITLQSHLTITPQRKFSDQVSPRQQIRRHTVHSDLWWDNNTYLSTVTCVFLSTGTLASKGYKYMDQPCILLPKFSSFLSKILFLKAKNIVLTSRARI
jgi:hypothetical protein